jgi:hypothetical protein
VDFRGTDPDHYPDRDFHALKTIDAGGAAFALHRPHPRHRACSFGVDESILRAEGQDCSLLRRRALHQRLNRIYTAAVPEKLTG